MLLYRYSQKPTTSGGKWSGNTNQPNPSNYRMQGKYLQHIYVRSKTSTTTFDVIIRDEEDFQIRRFLGATGIVNDLTPTPVMGPISISIENASVDEQFEVLLIFADVR